MPNKPLTRLILSKEYPVRREPRGWSHEKFHAAPSKKQACFLEGLLPLRNEGKEELLRTPPLLLRRCCVEVFMAYPLLLPS